MGNIIYWFSGTGNSLSAARFLAGQLGDTVLSPMTGDIPQEAVGGPGDTVGFVFPSYYGDLPRAVRAFAEKLPIAPQSGIFAVVTMGAFGQGSVKAMAELLEARGLGLFYGAGVRMPANYILRYDPALFGAKSARRVEAALRRADRKLARIAQDIARVRPKIETTSLTAKTLYEGVEALDTQFRATEACTACGLCQRICPAGNIALEAGRPRWLHRCEHCVACISWCPAAAIEYGLKTARRTRYRNPRVSAADIAAQAGGVGEEA